MAFNIVLVEPEIPQNTGNIVRTAVATGTNVHLVKPLGFEISDKTLKRAGLDYWKYANITYYENIEEFFEKNSEGNFYFASTKSKYCYTEVAYRDNDFILFGKETKGLDENLLKDNYEKCIRIPMICQIRSLNLSNSVAIVLYEALRQTGFSDDFAIQGKPTTF